MLRICDSICVDCSVFIVEKINMHIAHANCTAAFNVNSVHSVPAFDLYSGSTAIILTQLNAKRYVYDGTIVRCECIGVDRTNSKNLSALMANVHHMNYEYMNVAYMRQL